MLKEMITTSGVKLGADFVKEMQRNLKAEIAREKTPAVEYIPVCLQRMAPPTKIVQEKSGNMEMDNN